MRALSVKSESSDPCGFDFRTRLLASLAFSTVTIYLSDERILAALAVATFVYLVASTRRYRLVAAAYALMLAMSLLSIGVIWGSYSLIGAMLAGTKMAARFAQMKESVLGNFHTPFLRMLPSMNVMLALVLNLSVQKFTGTLKALRMPRVVFLPLLVFCRFVPEFVDVVRQLRDAVRMRGFSVSFGSALVHPFQTVRLTVVPLAVRTLRMADNLAMAAEMRRVGYAARPTHLTASVLRRRDWLMMSATVAVTAAVVLWQSSLPQKPSMMSRRAAMQEKAK
ncbi:MAG: energy-coupling factor transporter transmembrane protein EcfT [Kiritimatiellae bacterium]|nr:energy-coupling factor transporter transmembrane protein EcfT [Kiritimatiellia bacterium]